MSEQGYNGWRNYETWVTKLWIDNDQGEQETWLEAARALELWALADSLKVAHEERYDELTSGNAASVFSDLMGHALGCVNWYEIAKSLIEDAKEID